MVVTNTELIDTQWDVNFDAIVVTILAFAGINRYIVGCKLQYGKGLFNRKQGINRYIVGCKFLEMKIDRHGSTELIDTQWDVNSHMK